jgi:hypothetical protein
MQPILVHRWRASEVNVGFSMPSAILCYTQYSNVLPHLIRGQEIWRQTNNKSDGLHLTFQELEVLLPLAADQLFRNEFIDRRIPGFPKSREEIQAAKAVVSKIKERLLQAQQKSTETLRISIQCP